MSEQPCMDIREFCALGLAHEINRLILHPLGLAMAIGIEVDGQEYIKGIVDYREYPEGVKYGDDLLSGEKASTVARMLESRGFERKKAFGFVVQPVPFEFPQLALTIKEPVQHREPV